MDLTLTRLVPEPGTVTPAESIADLVGRECLVINMVTSVDGRAAVDGRTRHLGTEADSELFHALRAHADAIWVGTGTITAERYGSWIKDERRAEMRRAAGLERDPVGVLVSRRLDIPWDIPLFADPDAVVVIYTTEEGTVPSVPATIDLRRLDEVGPRTVLRDLRSRHGVRSVLCEGGPTLNGALFGAGVVDELFLTISPTLVGGPAPLTILEGRIELTALELQTLHEAGGDLFLRYRVPRG